MKPSLLTSLAVTAAAALTLSACGGGSSSSSAATDADVVVDALDSLTFDKTAYSATAGDIKIAYVNKGSINHTLLVVSADGKQIGPKLEIGGGGKDEGTYSLAAGQYTLFCDVPGHGNMKAVLTLTDSGY